MLLPVVMSSNAVSYSGPRAIRQRTGFVARLVPPTASTRGIGGGQADFLYGCRRAECPQIADRAAVARRGREGDMAGCRVLQRRVDCRHLGGGGDPFWSFIGLLNEPHIRLPGPPRVQSDGPPESLSGQSAGHQSPCGSVVCPTSMM